MAIRRHYAAMTTCYGLHFDREVRGSPKTGRVGELLRAYMPPFFLLQRTMKIR